MSFMTVAALVLISTSAWGQVTLEDPAVATLRPDPEGVPTRVAVGVYILDVSEIDDTTQAYTADLYVSALWRDPRLADPVGSGVPRRVQASTIWTPELVLLNQRSHESLLSEEVVVDPNGDVLSQRRLYGELSSPFDRREFPLDDQILPLRVVSARHGTEEVVLEVAPRWTGRSERFSIVGWALELSEARTSVFIPLEGVELAEVQFPLRADREVAYYVWTTALPLVLIVLMAWSTFWINPTQSPTQISVATGSAFTLIAFRLSLRLTTPRVSYMSREDFLVLGCTLLVFAALAQAVLTGRLVMTGREEQAHWLDRRGRWMYLGALVLLIVLTLWW
jgi:hypothetical protein